MFQRFLSFNRVCFVCAFLVSVALVLSCGFVGVSLAQTAVAEKYSTDFEEVAPDALPADAEFATAAGSAADREAIYLKVLELREKITDAVNNNPPMETALLNEIPVTKAAPTHVAGSKADAVDLPADFLIGRNVRNSRALTGSTLAEPAAANEGKFIFYMGNTYASYSIDGGVNWVNVVIPAGPADAPILCCDPDVIYDKARGVIFWSFLYTNAAQTNGVVRIFVRPVINLANACSYTFDPGGVADNVLPDYPHLGLSNDFLYLTNNNIGPNGWAGSQVRRLNADQMASCVGVVTNTFTHVGVVGQRVFVPAEGARETMYWGAMEAANSIRIFSWPEAAAGPSSVVKNISLSTFANPDCRGGVGNFDFIERSTAFSIAGFRMRSAVGANRLSFFWNVGADAAHTQGHVHSAAFRQNDLALIAEPHIFNNAFCFGFPAVSANERGDLGLTIAAGGRLGGGGNAARGFVGLDDDYTAGFSFGTLVLTAAGTHNRSDGRFGDYFNIHPHSPAGLFFTATNYSLLNGTLPANVNARYIEFGRDRDRASYFGWRDAVAP